MNNTILLLSLGVLSILNASSVGKAVVIGLDEGTIEYDRNPSDTNLTRAQHVSFGNLLQSFQEQIIDSLNAKKVALHHHLDKSVTPIEATEVLKAYNDSILNTMVKHLNCLNKELLKAWSSKRGANQVATVEDAALILQAAITASTLNAKSPGSFSSAAAPSSFPPSGGYASASTPVSFKPQQTEPTIVPNSKAQYTDEELLRMAKADLERQRQSSTAQASRVNQSGLSVKRIPTDAELERIALEQLQKERPSDSQAFKRIISTPNTQNTTHSRELQRMLSQLPKMRRDDRGQHVRRKDSSSDESSDEDSSESSSEDDRRHSRKDHRNRHHGKNRRNRSCHH